ncbi:MAG: radical SAM protein [Mariprofundaceae bacterium]|nr:radical SAM protein [Mariprofundaceae bacterium]
MTSVLNAKNHDRDAAGMTYVYPVVSRRAGGVSVGINLNPNNACNWHCAYCQVPNLTRGIAPAIDLTVLHAELTTMLDHIIHGDFMRQSVPEDCQLLCDIAISGNGEPTSCREFDKVVDVVLQTMGSFELLGVIPVRLISNGSYIHKTHVQRGLHLMAANKGEVWVKVDAATDEAIARINGVEASAELLFKQVKCVAEVCPSWIQTCMLAWHKKEPSEAEINAYLAFLARLKAEKVPVKGVLLYGLARPSLQPEAVYVSALSAEWMEALRDKIEATGFAVKFTL